jgi:hypothetical protein
MKGFVAASLPAAWVGSGTGLGYVLGALDAPPGASGYVVCLVCASLFFAWDLQVVCPCDPGHAMKALVRAFAITLQLGYWGLAWHMHIHPALNESWAFTCALLRHQLPAVGR